MSHTFAVIRRDIPVILRREFTRHGLKYPVRRRVAVKLPDLVRTESLANPVRVERLPRIQRAQPNV